ncbi:hypothetical protein ACWN8V_06700 [Vagococcus elongatus]|uniref:Uncharacterized protein n=1 Tax=Vagococcus elongatus TaxID=180344 RepID=A0A430AVZ1_9ENTE|nr:hypothetical protein [Vagococcus elongatus]RSU12223.1 hypothetical protein CBF29_06390 [Vagococcus elongatus]
MKCAVIAKSKHIIKEIYTAEDVKDAESYLSKIGAVPSKVDEGVWIKIVRREISEGFYSESPLRLTIQAVDGEITSGGDLK